MENYVNKTKANRCRYNQQGFAPLSLSITKNSTLASGGILFLSFLSLLYLKLFELFHQLLVLLLQFVKVVLKNGHFIFTTAAFLATTALLSRLAAVAILSNNYWSSWLLVVAHSAVVGDIVIEECLAPRAVEQQLGRHFEVASNYFHT